MTRSLSKLAGALALAGLFGLASSAQAQSSSVQLYGLMDMSAGQFQTAGAQKVWRADSGNMTTSFLGFKGAEDLGGGLKAVFKIEHFLRADSGSAGRFNGDAFWARNAYVGLQGEFGTTTLGRNTTPLFVSTLIFNAIGDSFGFSPSIRQVLTPNTGAGMLPFFGDTGWSNSVLFSSANYGGLSFSLLGNLGEGSGNGKNLGGNVLYFGGPLSATFAYQQVKNGAFGTPAGFDKQDTWQLGAAYDFTAAKVYGQYTSVKTAATVDTKTKVYGLGVTVPVGAGKVLAQYGNAKAEYGTTVSNKTLTVGYDYNLSKNTDVYAIVMNDKVTNTSTGNSIAAGIRLRF
jgi:predicted porin